MNISKKNIEKYNIIWYINPLDYEIIKNLKKKKQVINKMMIFKKRLDLFEFPMAFIFSMY
tara:strand:+ start:483 stop:662 length:180 start_codon:yes stop_codon:yes gene_type:complete